MFLHGSDYLRFDPDGRHARLQVSSALRDRGSGAVVRFDYTGVIDISGPAGAVLKGLPGAGTTGFGDACELVPRLAVFSTPTFSFFVLHKENVRADADASHAGQV